MKKHKRKSSLVITNFHFADNKNTFLFITLFTLGMVLGSFSFYFAGSNSKILLSIIQTFTKENRELALMALLSRNLVSNLVFIGFFYVLGLCAIGLPFIAIVPVIKGISLGTLISYAYVFNGIKGFLFALVLIFLPESLLLTLLCFGYSEAICMSLTVSNGIFASKPRELKRTLTFMAFSKRFLLIALGVITVSFLQALLTRVFSELLM